MPTPIRDLWPADVVTDEVVAPGEILQFQADRLGERTNGLLVGHVTEAVSDDRVVLGFEVEAPRAEKRVRLFEVHHRKDFEYPVSIISPNEDLPTYLKDRVSLSGQVDPNKLQPEPGWIVRDNIASSPSEFSDQVATILARPAIKAIVLSLLARANRSRETNGNATSTP